MNKKSYYAFVLVLLLITCVSVQVAEGKNPYIGRWALTIPGGGAGWLGVTQEDGYLDASILWGGGSVVPVASVYMDGDSLVVTRVRKIERKDSTGETIRTHTLTDTIIADIDGDTLKLVQMKPYEYGTGAKRREFTGKRSAPLPPKPDLSGIEYGNPIVLFNGKNLDGFYILLRNSETEKERKINEDPKKVFTVQDGMLRASGEEWGYIITEKEYENYRLVVEWKWGESTWPPRKENARDSGILLHCVGPDKVWKKSIEYQIIEGGTGDFILVDNTTLSTLPYPWLLKFSFI